MVYNNSIEVTHICPLRWVEPLYDYEHFPIYMRKMGSTDTWRIQFLSDNDLTDTFKLVCYSYNYGFKLTEFTFTKSTLSTAKYYWDAYPDAPTIMSAISAFSLHYLDTSVYFQIETTDVLMRSMPVLIGTFSDTINILAWNSTNDFGTVFGDYSYSTLFSFRVEGCFPPGYYTIGGEYETFENQKHEPTVTYSNPYGKLILLLGDASGLTDDMVEQVHRFLSLDTILIGMTHYVRDEIAEESNDKRGTRQLKVTLIPATNNQMQNILGESIYILNEDGNVETTEEEEMLIL